MSHRFSRYLLRTLSALLLVSLALSQLSSESLATAFQEEADGPRHWRVIWQEDPAHEATISWSTKQAGSEHRVLISKAPTGAEWGEEPRQVEAHRNGEYTRDAREKETVPALWFHHAKIDGLEPSTTYWFRIQSDGVSSRELHFVTAPEDDRPFKIIYGGDSRSGHKARQDVNRLMAKLCAEDPAIMAFAHGGDYIMYGYHFKDWSAWLDHHELCVAEDGRVLPMIPVRGNHDVGPLYDQIFDEPGGKGRNYYVTQLGPEAVLVTLNSEISTTGDQALWLEEALEALRPSHRWLLTQFHRPLYPAVKTPGVAKSTWVPLFEAFDVDLVLESDGHVVKRTMPIRDEKHDPTGVTYIGEGGLGVPQRTPDADRWYLKPPGMTASGHHVTVLEFTPEHLRMTTVGPPPPMEAFAPKDYASIVPMHSDWSYLAGSDPEAEWITPAFDANDWPVGQAGFGYGDEDDNTLLEDMRSAYSRVYLRRAVPAEALREVKELALMIRHDDGFVAYAGGVEFARHSVGEGAGPAATDLGSHEARSRYGYYPIPDWRERLVDGSLLIAVEGHNTRASSSDFSLDPFLIADPGNLPLGGPDADRVVIDDHKLFPREL